VQYAVLKESNKKNQNEQSLIFDLETDRIIVHIYTFVLVGTHLVRTLRLRFDLKNNRSTKI